jgi:hypothetical protein
VDIPRLSDSDIEVAAHELLAECFGTTSPAPPVDLDQIVYEHLYRRDNLRFSDENDLGVGESGDEILGKTMPKTGRILVTSRLAGISNRGRRRFTTAHELGHWVLHRPVLLAFLDQPSLFGTNPAREESLISYRLSVFPRGPASSVSRQEYQANRFAIALLVNPAILRDELVMRFGDAPLYRQQAAAELRRGSIREFATTVASQSRGGLRPLNEVFGVSKQAMAITLEEYGFVSEVEPLL